MLARKNAEKAELLRRAWDYHKDLDLMTVSRMNYSMVAQAMPVTSFMVAFVVEKQSIVLFLAEFVVCAFGIFYGIVQIILGRSSAAKSKMLKDAYLKPLDPIYAEMRGVRPTRPTGVQSVWIPLMLIAMWSCLLALAVARLALVPAAPERGRTTMPTVGLMQFVTIIAENN